MLIDYPALSDNELHARYRSGDAEAGNQLALRYRRFVKACTRPYFLAGGDSEDLLQEGMIGLLSAMREYDADSGASFRTYAEICIRRRIISAARSAARQKHAPLNNGVPLDDFLSEEEKHKAHYSGASFVRSAEDQVLEREEAEDFLAAYSRYLSSFELHILKEYLDGLSYAEIAAHCGRSEKSVDNAVQRIRKKMARHLSNSGDFS